MKRLMFFLMMLLCIGSNASIMQTMSNQLVEDDIIELDGPRDLGGAGSSYPRTPIARPTLTLDGHTLYFNTPCDGYELRIVDGNAVVVYSLFIPLGCTQVLLPATLLGEFELQLITGNLMFYGTIEL